MYKRGKITLKILLVILCSLPLSSCGEVSNAVHTILDYKTERVIGKANLAANSNSKEEYVYQTLSDEEKLTYDQMYECMFEFKESVPLTTKDEMVIKRSYNGLIADYGESFYWVYGYSFQTYKNGNEGYISGVTFSPHYTMTPEEKKKIDSEIESVYKEWIKDLPEEADDYTKSKYVYEKLIHEVDYVSDAPENQNIISVFLNRATVCKGYACAASYFFDKLGIPCTVVIGEANGGSHAWNLVNLDGEYYYYDVTWGNSAYKNSKIDERRINYSYLNIAGEDIVKTHEAQVDFPLPECISSEDNYFHKEGLFFDNSNYEEFGQKILEKFTSGYSSISIRFLDEDLYNKAFAHLIDEDHFVDYCPGTNKIMYIEDKEVNTLTLIF